MIKVMFLCTGNSCRSQMAEGLARDLGKDMIEVHSAGLFPVGVNPYAIKVMREMDIDISGQLSSAIDPDLLNEMDLVITLCGNAEAQCPATPPGIKRIHWPIDDPIGAVGTEEEVLSEFRRARDEIKGNIIKLIDSIKNPSE